MTMASIETEAPLHEPTLEEELAALGEEDVFEMVNLRERDTGIMGVLFLSTVLGPHGPRVKYYLRAGRDQPSFSVSIAPEPRVLVNSLPVREMQRGPGRARLGRAQPRSPAPLLERGRQLGVG